MDILTYSLRVEGVGRKAADEIGEHLADRGLAGGPASNPGVTGFRPFAFARDYHYEDNREHGDGRGSGCAWFSSLDEVKDYPAEEVGEISEMYPEALFVLEGHGHEEDCFRSYFLGGRVQEAGRLVTYEPFDASKLEPRQPSLAGEPGWTG